MPRLTCIELCAGGGGTALGLEEAGFKHVALVERDPKACETLRLNRPAWNVLEIPLETFENIAGHYAGVDLLSAGVPCPPFSDGGKKLGEDDERNLFPVVFRIVKKIRPKAVMIENVSGLMDSQFDEYRHRIAEEYQCEGYEVEWRQMNAADYGVPQLRPRVVMVAILKVLWPLFSWPSKKTRPKTVGEELQDLMSENGWKGAAAWAKKANQIAPTLVGGSEKHGGPDLGPTRARQKWALLGVNGKKLADEAPPPGFKGTPHLTVRMTAKLQGFPDNWRFAGGKTRAYRQVGNAFPPPVAAEVGRSIRRVFEAKQTRRAARAA